MADDQPGLAKRLGFESVRISSQHQKLNELYAALRRELERGQLHNAIVCFGRMRDALEAHFEVEDRVYFPAVRGFLPNRVALLDKLWSDHEVFRTELVQIDRVLEAHDLDETGALLRRLVARLLTHEQEEDELLDEIKRATQPLPKGC